MHTNFWRYGALKSEYGGEVRGLGTGNWGHLFEIGN